MDKKVLRWNFIFQYGWVITNIFNSLLLLPLYLVHIDKDVLGVWLVSGNVLGLMTIVDPGVGEILQQRIAELRGQFKLDEVGKTIGSGLAASFAILVIACLIGFGFYFCIGYIIDKDISKYANLPMALLLSIFATALSLVSFGISGINQGLHNSAAVAICSLSANFLFLFVNLIGLYLGWGVLSIAAANLFRALYITIFNLISLRFVTAKHSIHIFYEGAHFKRFIKIFSFTSTSKIISVLSYSVEMTILGRYLLPSAITTYEINKRPINISYSLIGRHSVALMPLISNWKGKGDKESIMGLVSSQFRFYSYATIFACLMFIFNYENLITIWTGPGQFAGNTIVFLLVASFFLSLISYYMAIIGYALGDIKMNSLYNIIRNVVFGILMFFAAKHFGIIGSVSLSIAMTLCADIFFYTYRLEKMGYHGWALIRSCIPYWTVIVPAGILFGWSLQWSVAKLVPQHMKFITLLINGGTLTVLFCFTVLFVDKGLRKKAFSLTRQYIFAPINRMRRA